MFEGQHWSYHNFNAWANRIAHVLQAQGVRAGDTVGLLFENHPELSSCVAALTKIGAVAGLLVGASCLATLRTAFARQPVGMPWLWVGEGQALTGLFNLGAACAAASIANLPGTDRIKAGQTCYFVFTSGTTGQPMAAVMTHLRWLRYG